MGYGNCRWEWSWGGWLVTQLGVYQSCTKRFFSISQDTTTTWPGGSPSNGVPWPLGGSLIGGGGEVGTPGHHIEGTEYG